MILFKSAIREAVMSGRLTIQDDEGHPFPGWDFPQTVDVKTGLKVLAPVATTVYDLTAPGIVVASGDFQDPVGLQPASIDLHLGNHWLVPEPNAGHWEFSTDRYLDTALPIDYHEFITDTFIVPTHGFVLVRTQEVVGLNASLFGKVDGRSSFGRAGLFAETAGVIDNGFKGSITLEVVNALPYPVRLYAGTRCCQITLYEGKGSAEDGYRGSYQGQLGTKGSMLYKTVPGGVR